MRKLASIQKITNLTPIEGADAIEVAQVLGWQVVVKKGEFSVGDLCVYCEIDSILPEKPEFEFLRTRKFRIRTIKLRGQISQGICFPLSILPNNEIMYLEDADVTEVLGVQKYDPDEFNVSIPNKSRAPVYKSWTKRWIPKFVLNFIWKHFPKFAKEHLTISQGGPFPEYVRKTDETRVQVLQRLLTEHKGELCFETEKLDGSSITIILKDGDFKVCSRNLNLREAADSNFWKAARELDVENKMREAQKAFGFKNFALQGELIGEGIQGNKYNIKGHTIRFFNIFDIDKQQYIKYADFIEVINAVGLETIPILSDNFILIDDINELVSRATRKSVFNPKIWQEGTVYVLADSKDRISFKAINPRFLLEYDEE
jgi:hypothetical protein